MPHVAEREVYLAASVPEHVRMVMDGCAAAIVFAETAILANEKHLPGLGLAVEVGILQERFPQRVVYFLEEAVDAGAMVAVPYTRFSQSCLEEVFVRLIKQFSAYGLLGREVA